MPDKSWKKHERETAKYFGTTRRLRGDDYSQEDVEILFNAEEWLSSSRYSQVTVVVECKYRKQIGIFDNFKSAKQASRSRKTILRIGEYILCDLKDFKDVFIDLIDNDLDVVTLSERYCILHDEKKQPKYLDEYLEQAQEYCKNLPSSEHCLPLVSLARASTPGKIICVHSSSITAFKQYISGQKISNDKYSDSHNINR